MRRPALAVLLLMPCLALAQSTDDRPPGQTTNEDDRWHIGLAASVRDSPYAGEGTRTRPLPLLGFEGERVFWRGLSGGVHLVDGPRFTLDAIVSGRFDGFADAASGAELPARRLLGIGNRQLGLLDLRHQGGDAPRRLYGASARRDHGQKCPEGAPSFSHQSRTELEEVRHASIDLDRG